jgi:hypothetical protein
MLVLLKIVGHYELYVASLKDFLSMSQYPGFHHSRGYLLKLFIKDHFYAFSFSASVAIGLSAVSVLLGKVNLKVLNNFLIVLISCIATVMLQYWLWIWVYTGMAYLILLLCVFNVIKCNKEFRLLAFLSFLILLITPLGSNNGMRNSIYGMWLALSVVFIIILQMKPFSILGTVSDGRQFKIVVKKEYMESAKRLICVTTVMLSLFIAYRYSYRDTSNRFALRYSINHPMLRGVFTTKERAEVVEDFLGELPKYVKADDYLFAFEEIPLVHFLTKTRTYLYTPWPMVYMPQQFKEKIDRAKKEHPLPVFVKAKASVADLEWPRSLEGLRRTEIRYVENRRIVHQFLRDNNYRKKWENSFFEIWTPGNQYLNMIR